MFIDSFIFLKGVLAGFFYTLAMLPSIVYVDKIVINRGTKNGIFASLGYVVVNTIFAILAAIILYFVAVSLSLNYKSLSLIGAMVLFVFAIRSYRKPLLPPTNDLPGNSLLKNFLASIFLGTGNPIVILGYLAFFSSLGIYRILTEFSMNFSLLFGTAIGQCVLWLILLLMRGKSKNPIPPKYLERLRQLSGLIFVAFSLIGLLEVYFHKH